MSASSTKTATVRIGDSEVEISPLVLGTNTFNHPDEPQDYHRILDGFVARGGSMLDTADMYSFWVPGNSGGESETVIGQWLASRRNRDQVIVTTKVAGKPGLTGPTPATIARSAEQLLRTPQTNYTRGYYSHHKD